MTSWVTQTHRRELVLLWIVGALGSTGIALLFLRLPAELFVVAPALIGVALVILRRPWLAGLALVLSVPAQQVGALGGGSLTATRTSVAISAAAVVIWWTLFRQPVVFHRGIVLFGALLAAMLASAQVASDHAASAAEIVRWGIAFAAFVVLLQFFSDGEGTRVIWLAAAIVGATALEALYGVVQSVRDIGPASFVVSGGAIRAFGTFGRPNTFAGFLEFGPFLGLALGLWFLNRLRVELQEFRSVRLHGFAASTSARRRVYSDAVLAIGFLGCAAVSFIGILDSFSRGAWLGVASGGLVFALTLGPRTRIITIALVPAFFVIVLGGAAGYVPTSIGGRFGSIVDEARPFDASTITITDDNFAAVERMAHWQAGWRMFEHHPALGVGIGNFNARYPDFYVREEFRVSQGHAHNIYIQMLAETGMLGLTSYLILFVFFIALAARVVVGSAGGMQRFVAIGCLATLVSVGVHDVFEDLHVLNISVMFAAVWALVIVAHESWRQTGTSASGDARCDVEYSPA